MLCYLESNLFCLSLFCGIVKSLVDSLLFFFLNISVSTAGDFEPFKNPCPYYSDRIVDILWECWVSVVMDTPPTQLWTIMILWAVFKHCVTSWWIRLDKGVWPKRSLHTFNKSVQRWKVCAGIDFFSMELDFCRDLILCTTRETKRTVCMLPSIRLPPSGYSQCTKALWFVIPGYININWLDLTLHFAIIVSVNALMHSK